MTLDELLHNPKALPTAPKVLDELISSFDKPNVHTGHIARTLSADPVLSAKLLRLANSAYYRVSRSIGTVDDAVRMLGFVTVRTLVISSVLVNGFRRAPGLDLGQFWRYSLHTAVSARWIASKAGEDPELAFTIGLMHAIGQVIIHAGMPEQARELDAVSDPYEPGRLAREDAAFGFNSSDAGAGLARSWKFPDVFAATILYVADPLSTDPPNRLACVIHLAAWRARPGAAGAFPVEDAAALGLTPALILDDMPSPAELGAGLEALIS